MKLLKTWKRALAVTCAVAITVTSIQVTPIVSQAATGDSTTFAVLSTTDVHGKVWETNLLNNTSVKNSLLNASTAVKAVRDTYGADNVVLIDNGDLFQGTPVSSYNIINADSSFDGVTPMAMALKYLDYDAFVLGNHEFNYPWSTMQKIYSYLESEADGANKVPVLAANLVYEETKDGHTAGDNAFTPYVTKTITVGGEAFKIGILGLENTDCTRWDVPDNYPNLRFASLGNTNFDMAVEAQKYVDQMKADGCDFIIASYHTGLGSYSASEELKFAVNTENQGLRVVQKTTGIDMLITGHDHSTAYSNASYKNADGKDVKVVNAGGTDLTKTVFTATKTDTDFTVSVNSSENVILSGYAKDTVLEAMVKPYADAASAYVNQPCGTINGNWDTKTNYYLEQTDTMDLINRAQIAMGTEYMKAKYASGEAIDINALQAEYGTDYTLDVDLSATSVVVDSNYTVKAGDLSIKDIYKFYRYDNSLYVLPISGKQIKAALEFLAEKKYTATPKNGAMVYKGGDFTTPVFYGLDFFYDLAKPVGERVTITSFKNGKVFNENQMYNIAINNYHLGNAEGPFGDYKTTDALWSQTDDLGGGTVQELIAGFVEAAGITGVAPDRSIWYLTWSGEIPKEEVVSKKPVQIYDPISDDVFTGEYANAVNVKDAVDKTGTGTVIGQVVYTYTDGAIIEDVIGGNVYGYLLYAKGAGKTTYNVGDIVAATGTFYSYYGLPEMSPVSSVKVISSPGAKFAIAPEVMSPSDVKEADINKYVIFKDVPASTTQMADSKASIPALGITSLPAGVSEGGKIDAKGVITYDYNNLKLRSSNADVSAHVANYDPITETFDAEVLNISEAVAKTSGNITVMGQVAYIYGGYNNAAVDNGSGSYNISAVLQDVIDGKVVSIQIYDKRVQTGLTEAQKLHVGDVVKVTGTRGDYGNTIKLAQITLDGTGTVERVKTEIAFQPETITISQIKDYLNHYVRINGVTLGKYDGTSSAGTPISDVTGTSAIYRGAEIPASVTEAIAADSTKSASVVGVASGYSSTQVRVGSSFDYSVYTAPAEVDNSTYTIPVVETSDVHGFVLDTSSGVPATYQYRMAYVADAVDKLRNANDGDMLLLDGGDIYQGNPVSNLQAGKAMTATYDAMKYDAVALGNHEFDWGVTTLLDPDGTMGSYSLANGAIAGNSQIPVLCSNIYYKDNSQRVDFTKDYVIVDKKGVNEKGKTKEYKVAIFGYADDYSKDIMTARIAPYKIVEDDLSKIQTQAKAMEANGTADVSILLVHADSKEIAEKLGANSPFDLVVGGHTHMTLNGVASNGVAYMQPQNQAKNYAYSELVIDADNKVSVANSKNVPVYESATKAKLYDTPANAAHLNSAIVTISKAAVKEVEPIMNEVLGAIPASVTKTPIGNNPMSSVAGTWMAEYMNAATGAKVSFTNAGGLRTEFLFDSGETTRNLTAGDVYTMAPFDNKLPTFNFTYEELVGLLNYTISDAGKKALDMRIGGATAYYTGNTITALLIDDTLIYDNGQYLVDKNTTVKVCTNEYIATFIGSPFEHKTSLESAAGTEAAIDNVSYIAALKAESLANNGKLHVTTEATLVNGEYSDGGSGAPSGGNNSGGNNGGDDGGSTTNPSTPGVPVVLDKAKEVKTNIDVAAVATAASEKNGSFYTAEGKKITDSLVTAKDGNRYIVDSEGAKYIASIVSVGDSQKYITDTTGEIITGSIVKTNGDIFYATKDSGKIVTSKLFKLNGSKYYAAESGAFVTGKIVEVSGKMYYTTKATGKVVADKLFRLDGKKYIANKSGSLITSKWVTVDGKKYYCDKKGVVTKTK